MIKTLPAAAIGVAVVLASMGEQGIGSEDKPTTRTVGVDIRPIPERKYRSHLTRKNPNLLFVDDHAVLNMLRPIGISTDFRGKYQEALAAGLSDPKYFSYLMGFLEACADIVEKQKGRRAIIVLGCRKAFGQNALDVLRQFVLDNIEAYWNNYKLKNGEAPINHDSQQWANKIAIDQTTTPLTEN